MHESNSYIYLIVKTILTTLPFIQAIKKVAFFPDFYLNLSFRHFWTKAHYSRNHFRDHIRFGGSLGAIFSKDSFPRAQPRTHRPSAEA